MTKRSQDDLPFRYIEYPRGTFTPMVRTDSSHWSCDVIIPAGEKHWEIKSDRPLTPDELLAISNASIPYSRSGC